MKRKLLMGLLALMLLLLPVVPVFAAETAYPIPSTKTSVTLPEGTYILGPEVSILESIWKEAGVENIASVQTIYNELGVCSHFVKDGNSVYVSVKETDQTGYYYNLAELKDETVTELAELYGTDGSTLNAESAVYETAQIPFIMVDMETVSQKESEQLYELIYFTIVNGQSITFRVAGEEPIDDFQRGFILDVVGSFRVDEFIPKADPVNPLVSWAVLIAIVVFFLALFFGARYSKKLQKKANRELADRLVEFRDSDHVNIGEAIFVNETDHDPEAVSKFSKFQAYKKDPVKAIVSIGITVVATVVSILSNSPWWLTMILAVLMVWCIYKLITGAGNIERAVTKVFSGLRTTVAHFDFYETEFHISGLQTKTNYPYFRITEARRDGNVFYIYFGEGTTYFIEKDGFIKGDFEEFVKFINRKVKESKK